MGRWSVLACALAACGGGGGGTGDSLFTTVTVPAATSPTHVWAFAPDDVWLLDGTATVQRYDGATWTAFPTPSTMGLGCIFALSPTDVWLCAETGVLHYDGTTFTMSDVTTPTGLDGLTALWASSPTDIFAVGNDAIVAHSDGSTWTRTIVGEPQKGSIWGSGPHDVYAMSVFEVSHFDVTAWTQVDLGGGSGGDGEVWGTGASDVWVMSGSSQVSHGDGATWTTSDLDITGELSAVWGPAPDDLWASGSAGSIAHWDGKAWTEVSHQPIGAPYLQQLIDVHGSSADDVWIVGHQLGDGGSTGLVYHHGP